MDPKRRRQDVINTVDFPTISELNLHHRNLNEQETYCHEQYGHRAKSRGDWKQKSSLRFKKKGIKSSRFKNYKKNPRMNYPARSVLQQNFPSSDGDKTSGPIPVKTDNPKREPLKCWGCREEHLLRDCPHRQQNS